MNSTDASQDRTIPKASCIDSQVEINWDMRHNLLGYLVEVHRVMRLRPATLFLAVNILDRYCSQKMVGMRYYQLAGCASLLVAAKFREKKANVPSISEMRKMCKKCYTIQEFVTFEWELLDAIKWTVDHPDTCTFIQTCLAGKPNTATLEHLSIYIAEVALFHRDFVDVPPLSSQR